ncbi:MAG: prepilin-type N-terminal cleavage/methylation domain-containing protein [Lachnospiraceae bacterium]|nr:prepilin-type N-terminal cleavage/methylation domain-containing protein [Lachnospiraceae bacterium]
MGKEMKENKGFSLVELIIVIAVMAVLIAVLAPLFIKYVEQSRRSRDIQTADQIREAFLADIAEGSRVGASSVEIEINNAYLPGTINETPLVAGHVFTPGGTFMAVYDADVNSVEIYVKEDYDGSRLYDLTKEDDIAAYKAA